MLVNSERSASDIERELRINTGLLSKWKQQYDKIPRKEEAFPGV